MARLIAFICSCCHKYNDVEENKTESCIHCKPVDKRATIPVPYIHTDSIKPYFDIATKQTIESKTQIDKICEEKGLVYGNDEDISQDCKRNKKYTEDNFWRSFDKGLHEEVEKAL